MKYQLYDCNRETVLLSDEIENIRSYIALEKMRIEEVVDVVFDSTIKSNGQQIAPFMLLSIIENAFKHVSQNSNKKNEIRITISQHDNWIHLSTENTVEHSTIENKNGLGLKNAKRRLELLYPGNHELLTSTSDGIHVASLKLKLQS